MSLSPNPQREHGKFSLFFSILFLIWKKIVFFFNKKYSLHQQGFFIIFVAEEKFVLIWKTKFWRFSMISRGE